ncbi:MAG: hypothetical protein LIO51_07615 [Clostridiales bacterium]|nr:hypothetical protein [Clostridiales bacterium]
MNFQRIEGKDEAGLKKSMGTVGKFGRSGGQKTGCVRQNAFFVLHDGKIAEYPLTGGGKEIKMTTVCFGAQAVPHLHPVL